MDKFDIRSAKLIGIFVIVILLTVSYLGYISTAYEKRSEKVKQDTKIEEVKSEEKTVANQDAEYAEEKDAVEEEKYEEVRNLYRDDSLNFDEEEKPAKKQFKELEPIDDSNGISPNLDMGADVLSKTLSEAAENQSNKNYEVAIVAYKKAVELTDDKFVKADCYESLADIFAQTKKYGSAMGYAQKAYNIKVTPKREFMLAKLYYKTGSTERALQKAEEIFKKDFAE